MGQCHSEATFEHAYSPSILITLMTMSFTSHAHNRSQSFSDWIVADNRIEAVFAVKTREITRLQSGPNQALDVLLSRHLAETIRVFHDKQACKDTAPPRLQPSAQAMFGLVYILTVAHK